MLLITACGGVSPRKMIAFCGMEDAGDGHGTKPAMELSGSRVSLLNYASSFAL